MTRHLYNSTVIRAFHNYPTENWFDHMSDVYREISSNITGSMNSIPGPAPGEVDWLFEKSEDALWFILRYGGELVRTHDSMKKDTDE